MRKIFSEFDRLLEGGGDEADLRRVKLLCFAALTLIAVSIGAGGYAWCLL